MKLFKVITDGDVFKVQRRFCILFWLTVQRSEDLDSKDFGGDWIFKTSEEAFTYVKDNTPKSWMIHDR